jgi:Na+/H+ antiporter NhaC
MGVIALVVPFAVSMAQQGAFAEAIGVATVVSGSMFGDNLSIVSDTTIAAVTTQGADPRKKFALNARVAIVAAVVTVVILACLRSTAVTLPTEGALNLWKTLPYVLLFFGVVILKWDVVGGLLMAISVATLMALADGTSPVVIGQSLYSGMQGMNEVLVISLFVGGLRGLLRAQGGMDFIVRRIEKWIRRKSTSRCCEFVVAGTVSLFDILLGNNTLAIIASGHMAQTLAHNFGVPAHRSAYLLDVFACIFQGILPYAPQILLASSLSGVAIFDIVGKVYYCYVLLLICIVEVCGHYRKGGVTAIS